MGDSDVDQVFADYDANERGLKQEQQRRARMEKVRLRNRVMGRRAKRNSQPPSPYQKAQETYITHQEDPDSPQDSDSDSENSDSDFPQELNLSDFPQELNLNSDPNPDSNLRSDLQEMVRKMIQEKEDEYRARETERDRVLQFRIRNLESEIQNLRRGYKIQIQKLHAQLQEFIQKYQLKYTVCKA